MKVMHVELGRHLYGGARQVAYLLNGLADFPDRHVLVCAPGAELAGAIERPEIRILQPAFGGDADLAYVARLRRLIRSEQPDLLHIHSRRGDWLAAAAGALEKCPVILSRRVDNPPRWFDVRLKFPLCRQIVTISEGIREVLAASGIPAERLRCIPSAVDTDRFRPGGDRAAVAVDLGIPPERLLVAIVAQLIPRKGHRVLFEALPAVVAQHPSLQLLVFGQGPLEAELRQTAAGLSQRVLFAGFRADLHRILPCLDLVVHPAFLEGLGVSLLEAAACGVPIVASRAGGMPEIVRDGENGYLVEPGDAATLANRIKTLLADPALRRRMGSAGRTLTLERFSIPRMVEDNRRLYMAIAAGAEPHRG